MNSITDLLDLEDEDIFISDTSINDNVKTLTLETHLTSHYCPCCGFRMHSRGVKTRKVNHPILQDGYELILLLKQRRWRCTNPDCLYETNDEFRFVDKNRRNTNAADILIINAFKDLSASASSIAERYNTSDTHVLNIFDKYVKLDRLPLSDIISVDEVFLNMDSSHKYALVIQDFHTGDPIDLLRSRKTNITEPYFTSIPVEERYAVKYLLTDMYKPYLRYIDKFFPRAVPIVDSFHVVQWVNHEIDNYIRQLLKKYKQRDRELQEQKSLEFYRPVRLPLSHEVYILQKYKWLILANQENITYHLETRMDQHFHALMNTYDYENYLFRIDPRLRTLRDLKEKYVTFNTRNAGKPSAAKKEIELLITEYFNSKDPIFINFASLLRRYKEPIINSFIMVEKYGSGGIYSSRLSNGPIESLNRKVKDLKRQGRGYRSFEHFRNRFLYATRNRPVLDGRSDNKQVQYYSYDDSMEGIRYVEKEED